MQVGRGGRKGVRNGVSVCESRMKMDGVKGGIKVFNGGGEEQGAGRRLLKRNQSDGVAEKRRRWSNEPIQMQLRKTRSEGMRIPDKNSGDESKSREALGGGGVEAEEEGERERFEVKEMNVAVEEPERVTEEEKPLHLLPPVDDLLQKPELPSWETEGKEPVTETLVDRLPHTPESSDECLFQNSKLPIVANKTRKQLPPTVMEHPSADPPLKRVPPPESAAEEEVFESGPEAETPSRLQGIVDLVMWKDISKSALIFGLGTFILGSSSFAGDLNFSLVSAASYMGLIYLSVVFFHNSVLLRGAIIEHANSPMGEEEAIWVVKKILPYFNELLLKLRSLFSGDPATTMKMAIMLFVLARCGGSITIWTMAKLAFFGVFTIPKLCNTYSTQLRRYANFWVRRFHDAWDSCTHKKAVVAAIFTVIWNLSSIIARIWAVFILIVGVKLYQQSLIQKDDWSSEPMEESFHGGEEELQRHRISGPPLMEVENEKKGS